MTNKGRVPDDEGHFHERLNEWFAAALELDRMATRDPALLGERLGWVTVAGRRCAIVEVPREQIDPAFGLTVWIGPDTEPTAAAVVMIRADLGHRVKRFVRAHEVGHLRQADEPAHSWLWRESRASGRAALCDPVGFFATVAATLLRPERRAYYRARFRLSS
jgi:hypothetical protein